jgi:hypothetical protein
MTDLLRGNGAKAKRLEWRKPKDDGQDLNHEDMDLVADGIGGLYCVQSDGVNTLLWFAHDLFIWAAFASVAQAQAAAEEDWQKRFANLLNV